MPHQGVRTLPATAGGAGEGQSRRPKRAAGRRNDAVNWDLFSPEAYFQKNYAEIRDDDRVFLKRLGTFFGEAAARGVRRGTGVDVGAGSNLYPALSMLPLCDEITLWEHGTENCAWLRAEAAEPRPVWDEFWDVLAEQAPDTRPALDPRRALAERVTVRQGSVFSLPESTFAAGTMFFVAESITEDRVEFERAVRCFTGSLLPGAPFAAAFMWNSGGYAVDGRRFPALRVRKFDIAQALRAHVGRVDFEVVSRMGNPLRDGYSGMILATGYTRD